MASFRSVLAGGRFVSGPGQLVSGRGDLFWPAAAWSSRGEPTSSKLFLFCRGVVKLVPGWSGRGRLGLAGREPTSSKLFLFRRGGIWLVPGRSALRAPTNNKLFPFRRGGVGLFRSGLA